MDINDSHMCVFCTENHRGFPAVTVECTAGSSEPHVFNPAGDAVLLGQIIEGKAVVTIHEDVTGDEIAMLMSAFMDRISQFEHIKRDPSVIMKALMEGVSGKG